MTLDMILIVALIVLCPTLAWMGTDLVRLRRDLDRVDAEVDLLSGAVDYLTDDATLTAGRLDGLIGSRSRTSDLPVPDVDEQLDVPDYDAPTTPTYRQENTNA